MQRPCFVAFLRERSLPSGVRGPVDLAAFWRLIRARRLAEIGMGAASRWNCGGRWDVGCRSAEEGVQDIPVLCICQLLPAPMKIGWGATGCLRLVRPGVSLWAVDIPTLDAAMAYAGRH